MHRSNISLHNTAQYEFGSLVLVYICIYMHACIHMYVCMYVKGLGENGEFGHICVFEKNEFEVLDVGARGDV